jgi:hypothetical protein
VSENERIYPCAHCGLMRSLSEGGRIFTVCDKCWDSSYAAPSVAGMHQLRADRDRLAVRVGELEERVHDERYATVAYLLDRAEQYTNSSGYRALFDELVGGIADGEHAVSLREGEYDDMRKQLDRIFATHTPKDALIEAVFVEENKKP